MKTILCTGFLILAVSFAACGGAKQIGYIGASSGVKPNALKIVEVDADTGEIAVIGSLPVANATYIAVNRARTRLYTSLADPSGEKGKNGGVAVYALDPAGGVPTHLETLATGHPAPCHLSLSPDEKKLVFAEYGRGTAGWVDLKTDGTFAKETLMGIVSEDPTGPNKPRQDRPHCHCARVTPDGKYICIVDLGTDHVKIYSAKTGAFVRDLVTTPAGAGPRHITFHPNGRFAFLLFELENYVTSYRYEDGTFTPIQQHKLTPEGFTDFSKAAAIKLSADGSELYCSNRGHESLAVFSVNAETGAIKRRGIIKLDGAFPWDFEIMPGGKVFAVGFQKDGVLRTYRYDAKACTLTPLADAKDFGSIFCTTFFPASGAPKKKIEVMAVYYPHWSVYPKGNEWFHPGWTEWEFARTAKPRFPGHKQPFKPLPGYLDGKDPTDVSTEIELASNAGIDVFLYDYYYYGGKITQQEALEEGFLKAPNRAKMKFALMWCYHERWNQFRPKYGQPRTKLMELNHTPEEFLGLIDHSIKNYFARSEYWRKDGKLFFSIFNANYFVKMVGAEKVKAALAEARRRVRAAGLGEVEFNAQNVGPAASAQMAELGFDSLTDYGFGPWHLPNYKQRYTSGELLFDFAEAGPHLEKRWADYRNGPLPYYPIVPTGWDVTPRCRPEEPFPWTGAKWNEYPYCGTFTNATPKVFESYLRAAKAAAENDPKQPGVVYINAWNEYTEGCSLLPSVRECDQMLRCVGRVFGRKPANKFVYCEMKHWWNKDAKNGRAFSVEAPTLENVPYGPHLRQNMDVWLPKPGRTDGKRTPCVIMIHGGGWSDGDRLGGVASNLPKCRAADCALVSISYRMVHDANDAGIKPPVKACLDDAVAAIKLVQAKAVEWNIDPTRIGLTGGSAGACSSLYASLQGDNVLGIRAVLAHSPQTSLDPQETKEWIPNARYGAHAFGYGSFDDWLKHRAECLPLIERYSPVALLRACTASRAPTFLYSCGALPPPGQLPKDPTHAAAFCVKFQEICEAKGIACRRGTFDDLLAILGK